MDKKEIILGAIFVVIVVAVATVIFAPSTDAKFTSIDVLNKGDLGINSTIYIKLADNEKTALSGKDLHVKLTNDKGKVVYEETVKTHATGVALAKLHNVSAGKYTLNVTFDGDENYTSSSISQSVTIRGEPVEDVVENSTLIQQTLADVQDSNDDSQSYSQDSTYSQSYTQDTQSYSQDTYDSSQSSSNDAADTVYDEDGSEILPEYDEDGNQVDPV